MFLELFSGDLPPSTILIVDEAHRMFSRVKRVDRIKTLLGSIIAAPCSSFSFFADWGIIYYGDRPVAVCMFVSTAYFAPIQAKSPDT